MAGHDTCEELFSRHALHESVETYNGARENTQ